MTKTFHIHYKTGPQDYVILQTRATADAPIVEQRMTADAEGHQIYESSCSSFFFYRYAVMLADGKIEERHWRFSPDSNCDIQVFDSWRSPQDGGDAIAAPAFAEAVFRPESKDLPPAPKKGTFVIVLTEPRVAPDEEVRLISKQFINWNPEQAYVMKRCINNTWVLDFGNIPLLKEFEFKFCIWDTKTDTLKSYEEGMNRIVKCEDAMRGGAASVYSFNGFNFAKPWRAAGVAVPIFSLRTRSSRGCGEFLDLKPLADWCVAANLKVIQLLPINDTTAKLQWRDSYPYNAISIMALHPSYISVEQVYKFYGKRMSAIERENGLYLNDSTFLEYNRTREWKDRTLRALFADVRDKFVADPDVKAYMQKNDFWLKDYAAFATLRNVNHTPNFRLWKNLSKHSRAEVDAMFDPKHELYNEVLYRVFLQYHLEKQLTEAIEYVHAQGIAIKGDLPIGINPHSVEAWTDPDLFDFSLQAGAPPDFFSRDGQNWGFPTYKWDVMAKDGYAWWTRRMQRMQMFFDVFRIDHILGFFRIWSIPFPFHSGLMGVFSPALPFSSQELWQRGVRGAIEDFATPVVTDGFLSAKLSEYAGSVYKFFDRQPDGSLKLKPENFTPDVFDKWIEAEVEQTARERVRRGVADILHEVLFVSVKEGEWHPRIMLEETDRYRRLPDDQKWVFKSLADDFFFNRNNDFWKQNAEEHLGALLDQCRMLVCGEDLGMIPASVPIVMQRLQILSLELQRMPKQNWERFGTPAYYPYLSVCATSSHDISGIRGWWEEDRADVEWYYHNMMYRGGNVPPVASGDIVTNVVCQHLNSPSMLCINPIQDYAGMLDNVPHLLPFEERINVPSNPDQMWRYRVPFLVDELKTKYPELHQKIAALVQSSGRTA